MKLNLFEKVKRDFTPILPVLMRICILLAVLGSEQPKTELKKNEIAVYIDKPENDPLVLAHDLQLASSTFQKSKSDIRKHPNDERFLCHCYNYGVISLICFLFYLIQLNYVVQHLCTKFSWKTDEERRDCAYRVYVNNDSILKNPSLWLFQFIDKYIKLKPGPTLQKGNFGFVFMHGFAHYGYIHLHSNTFSLSLNVLAGFLFNVKISPREFFFLYFLTDAFGSITEITTIYWNEGGIGASGACEGVNGFMTVSLVLIMIDKSRTIIEWGKAAKNIIVDLVQLTIEKKRFWRFLTYSLFYGAFLAIICHILGLEIFWQSYFGNLMSYVIFHVLNVILLFLLQASELSEEGGSMSRISGYIFFLALEFVFLFLYVTFAQIWSDLNLLFAFDDVGHIDHVSAFITGVLLRFASHKEQHMEARKHKFFQTLKLASIFILTAFFLSRLFIIITHK